MKAFLLYQKDEACGENIAENLRKLFPFQENGTFDKFPLHQATHKENEFFLGRIDGYMPRDGKKYSDMVKPYNPDLIVNLIWHEGNSGPLLSTHPIGNPTSKDHSLENHISPPKSFTPCFPSAMKNALLTYSNKKQELGLDDFEVCLETTHGAPTDFEFPFMDLEIGSTLEEWKNPRAGEAGAQAAMSVFDNKWNDCAVGFGDVHYSQKFTDVMLKSDVAVGHIFPSRSLDDFAKEDLENVLKLTKGNVKYLLLNKKEKSEHKDLARQYATELGLEVLNHKQVLKQD